jgi:glycosyltransferase involved in cell wall biosynthesis
MTKNDHLSGSSPAISVVIPAYNSEGTIREALASVASQTFRDYEIIVVDDASSDTTVEIAQASSESSGLKFQVSSLSQNSGPAASRNQGVSEAGGEWIAFLDADDVWLSGRLASQIALMSRFPGASMFCGKTIPIGESPSAEGTEPGVLKLADFIENNQVATSTVLIRKDVFLEVGGFDEQFRGPEDLDLWLRVAADHRVIIDSEPIAGYRSVTGSLSMDERKFLPEVLRVLDKAFGEGGSLFRMQELRETAVSTQLWNASWMAFCRGARFGAVGYWFRAYLQNRQAANPIKRQWFRLLARYLVGQP